MRSRNIISAIIVISTLAACTLMPVAQRKSEATYITHIRWTSYGIPHVKADNWKSLGYGFAYATAVDAVCVIAKDVVMVNGELTKYFGASEENQASDIFHRAMLTDAAIKNFDHHQSEKSHQFTSGYVAGYNRYVRDNAGQLPAACADQSWVMPMVKDDVARLATGVAIRYGLGSMQSEIAAASPPTGEKIAGTSINTNFAGPIGYGSNAVGMGRKVTETGRGLLLGNPHYPWTGSSRFHLIHNTIPGELDVMGASLLTTPRVAIGFNRDVAWTHTVSTALRATLYQLSLNPDNPLQYRYGDSWRNINARDVILPDRNTHTVYMSHYGPMLVSSSLPWNHQVAFSIRDANLHNVHTTATYDALNIARNTREVEAAISLGGVAWTNTVAADRHGDTFYADISVTPNVDAELLENCRLQPKGLPKRVVLLRGDDPGCEWREDARARTPGLLPPEAMPRLHREDYVANSNDSYWLTNPDQPLEGYSPIIGSEGTARSLRTRAGLTFIGEALKDERKVSQDVLQTMLYSHRNFGAELLLDDVLSLCDTDPAPLSIDKTEVNVSQACQVLRTWDRRNTPDSRGGHLWREFWRSAHGIDDLYATAFDPEDPVSTPRDLAISNPEVSKKLLKSLARAQLSLVEANIDLDAALGDIQFTEVNGRRIPVPGGEGWAGMWSMIIADLEKDRGYSPIIHGNSFIQVVSWDADGNVQPTGILTYSQSPEPDSAHSSDMTELYAAGGWVDLPFTEEEIEADPHLVNLHLTE